MGNIVGRFILPHPPILIPEIGKEKAQEGRETLDAFAQIGQEIARLKPRNIIVISHHSPLFSDLFYLNPYPRTSGDLAQFGHKEILLAFDNNKALVEHIEEEAQKLGVKAKALPLATLKRSGFTNDLDHGITVPLYFISHFYQDFCLVPIGLSGQSPKEHYLMGKALAAAIAKSGEDTVIIASGDLSHKLKSDGPYGFAAEGPVFEKKIENLLRNNDISGLLCLDKTLEEKAAQCGLYSIYVLCGSLEQYQMEAQVLSHQAPFGVGYLTASIKQGAAIEHCPLEDYLRACTKTLNLFAQTEAYPLSLARMALAHYLNTGKELPIPPDLPAEWCQNQGGVFVCFKQKGTLRGCIGTTQATQPNLAQEIICNAIAAGTRDWRFSPITPGEIKTLTVSLDVLGDLEDIESSDELDPAVYGVVVSSGAKKGLLLPNLEGIDTVSQQIKTAREKGGIPFYKPVKLQRFKVTRYE